MDVVVVGGGIIGTMHAWYAVRQGHRVIQLEREDEARGASVRNFGLVWISGRAPGPELALALRARTLWDEVAAHAPLVGLRPAGSMTLAGDEAQARTLADVAGRPDAAARQFRLLDPSGVRRVNPALRGAFTAGLYCAADAVVEPRAAARSIRAWLSGQPGYRWLPGREVVGHGPGAVTDDRGVTHRGDLVVFATGAWHRGLLAEHTRQAPLRRCRLQMMQTEPLDEPLTTAVADGDSLRYYPAFAGPTLDSLPRQVPIAATYGMQLLMVQRIDGSLTIGDTHSYAEPFGFDVDDAPYRHLIDVAEGLLGRRLPPIRRRWAGVYSQLVPGTDAIYHRSRLADGVVVVTGAGGRGMTLSPAIAEETFTGGTSAVPRSAAEVTAV